jgi:hypothetical protein
MEVNNNRRLHMTISFYDFNNLSEKDKKKTLENLKKEIGVGGMVAEWNISRSKVYSLLHQLDIAVSAKNHKLRPQKPNKPAASAKTSDNSDINITPPADNSSSAESTGARKTPATPSELDFAAKDDAAKFSLYLETQGTVSYINETIQLLLGSQKLEGSNLQVHISLQEL